MIDFSLLITKSMNQWGQTRLIYLALRHTSECRHQVIYERPQGGLCLTGCRNKSGMTAWRNDKSIESDPIDFGYEYYLE